MFVVSEEWSSLEYPGTRTDIVTTEYSFCSLKSVTRVLLMYLLWLLPRVPSFILGVAMSLLLSFNGTFYYVKKFLTFHLDCRVCSHPRCLLLSMKSTGDSTQCMKWQHFWNRYYYFIYHLWTNNKVNYEWDFTSMIE